MNLKIISLVFLFITQFTAFSKPQISYIIPDIGTPGFSTYMEVIGPFEPDNPDDLAKSIRFFADNRHEIALKARKGAEIVEKNFTWQKTADSVFALIEATLLKSSHRAIQLSTQTSGK